MPYELTFERHPDYIHATATGSNSRDVVQNYMEEILGECKKQNCFRLLIEEKLSGPRLQPMDVFAISSEGSMKVLGVFDAIAYVDGQMGDMLDFVETVAVNRGLPIGTFATVEEAEKWLSSRLPGLDDTSIFRDQEPANDD